MLNIPFDPDGLGLMNGSAQATKFFGGQKPLASDLFEFLDACRRIAMIFGDKPGRRSPIEDR